MSLYRILPNRVAVTFALPTPPAGPHQAVPVNVGRIDPFIVHRVREFVLGSGSGVMNGRKSCARSRSSGSGSLASC